MASQQSATRAIIWACASSWYYGYHLSELNFPVASLTCQSHSRSLALPDCLGIDSRRYSIITAIFTIGGLCGSLSSSGVTRRIGVKRGIAITGWLNALAAVTMAMSVHWVMLAIGRLIAGLSAGIAVCLVPPYLALVARSSPQLSSRSGLVGSMHQMGIVIGLFTAQVMGWAATGELGDLIGRWRFVVGFSAVVSVWQLVVATSIPGAEELAGMGVGVGAGAGEGIWVGAGLSRISEEEEGLDNDERSTARQPLLSDEPTSSTLDASIPIPDPSSSSSPPPPPSPPHPHSPQPSQQQQQQQLALRDLLSSPTLRPPTILCASILSLQQLSGVNAVMFYSTPVLQPLLPGSAALIGLGITGVNAGMTVPAMFLVDRVGRKRLLLFSVILMGSMSALLAYGLDGGYKVLSGVAIVAFIAAFSVGLGPIPFLFVSELVPQPAIPALSALSLSLSWTLNFLIALLFLPLRDALSSPVDSRDPAAGRINEGRVFYVFMGSCAVLGGIVWRRLPGGK